MSYVEETFQQYVDLRNGGTDAKAALETMRLRIELLDPTDKADMVRRVRAWETQRTNGGAPVKPASSVSPGAPSTPSAHDPVSQRLAQASIANYQPTPVTEDMIRCPHCRKPNKSTDVFCYACGEFLRNEKASSYETRRLDDSGGTIPSADYFGEESTLVLTVGAGKESERFKVRPQEFRHEVVIGRSDGGTMTPDVDLAPHNAGDQGVSRLHVALQYNGRNNILSISDMKSANGTFVNGQKLYPQEVRVLRHGDELRLGRMVLRVYFEHQVNRTR